MTPEKILEIARRYTAPEEEISILIDEGGNPTGGTLNMTMWNFCEEELIAFAQSVIEADRESSDDPVAYMMVNNTTTGLSPSLHFNIQDWHITWEAVPLYTRPGEST